MVNMATPSTSSQMLGNQTCFPFINQDSHRNEDTDLVIFFLRRTHIAVCMTTSTTTMMKGTTLM